MKTMTIEVNELRGVVHSLLQFLNAQQTGSFELEKDFYWKVPVSARYNPYEEPAHHRLGQLFDDWEDLRRLSDPGNATPYHFVQLSAILRYIGEVLSGEIEVEGRQG